MIFFFWLKKKPHHTRVARVMRLVVIIFLRQVSVWKNVNRPINVCKIIRNLSLFLNSNLLCNLSFINLSFMKIFLWNSSFIKINTTNLKVIFAKNLSFWNLNYTTNCNSSFTIEFQKSDGLLNILQTVVYY